MFWTTTTGPQTLGVGQQMSALNVFNANLLKFVGAAAEVATGNSGGTSIGDPNAGNSNSNEVFTYVFLFPFLCVRADEVGLRLLRRGIGYWRGC